jgi:hypothetical protein
MSRSTVETALLAVLEGVSGVEHVYSGMRSPTDPTAFITEVAGTTRTQAWMVWRSKTEQFDASNSPVPIANHYELFVKHTFEIEGHYGFLDDTTESEWQNLLDAILTAFNNQRTIGGWYAWPLTLQEVGYRAFGTLAGAHYCKIEITIGEIVSGLNPQ